MKSALCLYGQPRDAHAKFGQIVESVIRPNNCDVFFHAWYDPNNLSINKMTPGHENRIIHHGMDQFLIENYRPKSYILEKQRKFHHKNFTASDENVEACWDYGKSYDRESFTHHISKCMHSMWYSIMQSILLKELYSQEQGFEYDSVFLMRFDVSPDRPVHASNYDLSKLITRNHDYPRNEVSDWFMLSNNDNMNIVGSTFNMINSLYKKIQTSQVKIWTNEAFLRDNLKTNEIDIHVEDFNVTF